MIKLILLIIMLVICACSSVTPHENFKSHMQFHIGKKVDSPSSYIARYPRSIGKKIKLSNGNEEIEFLQGRFCSAFFEVDKHTGVIIAWRFEGGELDCEIVP